MWCEEEQLASTFEMHFCKAITYRYVLTPTDIALLVIFILQKTEYEIEQKITMDGEQKAIVLKQCLIVMYILKTIGC